MRRRLLLLLALPPLLLAGCVSGEDEPEAPTATSTPRSAESPSVDALLEEAENAFAAYLLESDRLLRERSSDLSGLEKLVTRKRAEQERVDTSLVSTEISTITGETSFRDMTIQSRSSRSMTTYVCVDVSDVRVLDGHGADITPGDRPDVYPTVLVWNIDEQAEALLLDGYELWSGDNFC